MGMWIGLVQGIAETGFLGALDGSAIKMRLFAWVRLNLLWDAWKRAHSLPVLASVM